MTTARAFFIALTVLMTQYGEYLKSKREHEIDKIEDEIDALAADGSPASKLRMERLAKRLKRKIEQLAAVHPRNGDAA